MTQLNSTHFASSTLPIHVTLHKPRACHLLQTPSSMHKVFSNCGSRLTQWLRTTQIRSEGNMNSMSVWVFSLFKGAFSIRWCFSFEVPSIVPLKKSLSNTIQQLSTNCCYRLFNHFRAQLISKITYFLRAVSIYRNSFMPFITSVIWSTYPYGLLATDG